MQHLDKKKKKRWRLINTTVLRIFTTILGSLEDFYTVGLGGSIWKYVSTRLDWSSSPLAHLIS